MIATKLGHGGEDLGDVENPPARNRDRRAQVKSYRLEDPGGSQQPPVFLERLHGQEQWNSPWKLHRVRHDSGGSHVMWVTDSESELDPRPQVLLCSQKTNSTFS